MAPRAASSRVRSWPDLASELLGLVLSRLPSHADRIRTAAVCRPWRAAARLQGPAVRPLLPLLALCDNTFLSLPDGTIHCLSVAEDVSNRVSTGSVLFLMHGHGGRRCSLMNLFSAMTTPLPELNVGDFHGEPVVQKVVVLDHLIAALIKITKFNSEKVFVSARDIIRCSPIMEWEQPLDSFIKDIALFKGKLHVLTTETKHFQRELHVLDGGQEQTIIRSIPRVDDKDREQTWYDPYSTDYYVGRDYLVASGDRLLVVQRLINKPPMMPYDSGIKKRTRRFRVFEAADLESTGHGRWIEVDTLMGRAIFLSEGCSESLPVVGECGDIGVRQECIYFITRDDMYYIEICENPMLDSGLYSMRDKRVTPLLLDGAETPTTGDGPWCGTWIFPQT